MTQERVHVRRAWAERLANSKRAPKFIRNILYSSAWGRLIWRVEWVDKVPREVLPVDVVYWYSERHQRARS